MNTPSPRSSPASGRGGKQPSSLAAQRYTVCLVGNPNCGKTTLINALTGSKLRVGNWPGVTVERKSGYFEHRKTTVEVVDLPGTYSLVAAADDAPDERIACEYVRELQADCIINVIDATNLERNLYLTAQLLELQRPMIVALTMLDLARLRRLRFDIEKLSQLLGCPVIALEANRGKGIEILKKTTVNFCEKPYLPQNNAVAFPPVIQQAIAELVPTLHSQQPLVITDANTLALRLLEGDHYTQVQCVSEVLQQADNIRRRIAKESEEDADIVIADARYGFAHQLTQQVIISTTHSKPRITAFIDRIVLDRLLGIPIFFGVMYLMFLFAINVGGAFQDFFDMGSDTIFVQGFAQLLQTLHFPNWLVAILASGAGKGINTTVTFIPVIGGMFLFLSLLEASGYMARAAFVMDRFMRAMGLPGKAFVPMIVGFGCNVPAIMATRTLQSRRDRVLTIMMSPFMSCGARLAIFAVFTAAFFPVGGQNVVFALYIIGIAIAVLTGFVLRKTLLQGEASPFIMELPSYHVPTLRAVLSQTWARLQRFLFKAGKLIIPICILIGALNSLTISGTFNTGGNGDQHSLLSWLGQFMTPIFAPLGIHQDNWPATVGLFTGTLAKEVVVATLNTLYTQVGHLAGGISAEHFQFWHGIKAAFLSIPENVKALPGALGNPILASAKQQDITPGVYGLMYQRFDGQLGAFAYLLFVLLYVPCVSTVAAMAKELNKSWAWFSVLWSTGLAYGVATLFYQTATFSRHPQASTLWIVGITLLFAISVFSMRRYALHEQKNKLTNLPLNFVAEKTP